MGFSTPPTPGSKRSIRRVGILQKKKELEIRRAAGICFGCDKSPLKNRVWCYDCLQKEIAKAKPPKDLDPEAGLPDGAAYWWSVKGYFRR